MPDLTKDAVLAPCPHCGSDELSYGYQFPPEQGTVQCHACGAAMIADDEDAAIAAWNRRAIAPLLDGGEEELIEQMAIIISGAPFSSPRSRTKARALLPLIHARIAQAEQAATERAALIADRRKAYWHDQWASKPNGWHVMPSSHEDEASYIAAAIRARKETTND